jgi:hypothetical protein
MFDSSFDESHASDCLRCVMEFGSRQLHKEIILHRHVLGYPASYLVRAGDLLFKH